VLILARKTRVLVSNRVVFPLTTVISVHARQKVARADICAVAIPHLTAKLQRRKNARRMTIVRRTKNAPTAIASIANKQAILQKKRPFGRFFLRPFKAAPQ